MSYDASSKSMRKNCKIPFFFFSFFELLLLWSIENAKKKKKILSLDFPQMFNAHQSQAKRTVLE
jgi:hypothetical protein